MKPVEFRVAGGVFTIRPGSTFLFLLMLVVLLGLGSWQIERLHWKENLLSEIAVRTHEAPVDVSAIADPANAEYRPVRASGLLQYDHEFYLHAISLKGEGGYHVLTPLQMDDGKYLLVDRGWVPFDKKEPTTRGDGQLFGPVTITGLLRLPYHRFLQPANNVVGNDWYGIDLPAMAKAAGVLELMPFVLDADATPNPGGYPVGGQTRLDLPNNHLSYAITWFGLAFALIVIYSLSIYRKVS